MDLCKKLLSTECQLPYATLDLLRKMGGTVSPRRDLNHVGHGVVACALKASKRNHQLMLLSKIDINAVMEHMDQN